MPLLVLTCDQCGKDKAFRSPSMERAITTARSHGWRIERAAELPDLCPTCKTWSAYP